MDAYATSRQELVIEGDSAVGLTRPDVMLIASAGDPVQTYGLPLRDSSGDIATSERGEPVLGPPRCSVVGTGLCCTSYEDLLRSLRDRPSTGPLTVAFCNVHSVMTARRDKAVAAALSNAGFACPDGVPLVWALRALGHRSQQRVYGPHFMRLALAYGVPLGWRHYFYGSTQETLEALEQSARCIAPGVRIVGAFSPPFRPLTSVERARAVADIKSSGADIVWIGLGMPKQELWAEDVADELPGVALMSVGAAFDLLSGRVRQAPGWVQRMGLEWLFRLVQEPRRLWRRYIYNNPKFVLAFALQLAHHRLLKIAERARTQGAGHGMRISRISDS